MLPRPPAPSLMLLFASLGLFLLLGHQGLAMPAAEAGLNDWLLRQACEPVAPWYRTPSLLGTLVHDISAPHCQTRPAAPAP